MKAMIYMGPERLEMGEAPMPAAADGEVLVRIASSGICGSDMHAFLGHDARRPAPLILGHEAAGITEDGRRVTINPLNACGDCDACRRGRENLCPHRAIISMPPREGAFAEYVAAPEANLVEVPQGIPLDHAALAEPLACGWHAARLAGEALDRPFEEADCAVIGGGAIGVGAALVLLAMGAGRVVLSEPNALRRERLGGMGFEVAEAASGAPDLVIDAVGIAPTRAAASAIVRPGGVIAHIGLGSGEGGLDIRRMTLQEIAFFGTYTYTAEDFRQTAAAMFDGRLGDLAWIETRPLEAGPAAFADIRAGRVAAPKIVLNP